MNPQKAHALLCVLIMVFAGCSVVEPETVLKDGHLSIRTEQQTYQASENLLSVQVTILNSSNTLVYVPEKLGAPIFVLERFVDGEWKVAYRPFITADLTPPTELEEGQSLSRTFVIQDVRAGRNRSPYWEIAEPLSGTYRFVIAARKTRGDDDNLYKGEPLPLEDRLSNTFELRE